MAQIHYASRLPERRGQARLSNLEFYYGFVTDDQLNATQIKRTMERGYPGPLAQPPAFRIKAAQALPKSA